MMSTFAFFENDTLSQGTDVGRSIVVTNNASESESAARKKNSEINDGIPLTHICLTTN